MNEAPPVLTDEFYYAIMDGYWRFNMSSRVYYAMGGKYQPIEDEV